MVPIVFAESYPIGIPFAVLGLALMVACKPIGNLFAMLQREWADFMDPLTPRRVREVASIWRRVGLGDDVASKVYRYGTVFLVGAMFFGAGMSAVIGFWNPYE
jgi:hypothetical protein